VKALDNIRIGTSVLVILTLGAFTITARGQLAVYQFGSGGNGSLASTDNESQSTAAAITLGAGLLPVAYDTTAGVPNPPSLNVAASVTANTVVAAKDANDYFEFTVTAETGFILDFSGKSISISYSIYGQNFSGNWSLYSSVDNYDEPLLSGSSSQTTWATTAWPFPVGYDNLTSLTLRYYVYDGNNGNNRGNLFDNIVLNGAVNPVPEPYEYGLIAVLGLIGFAAYDRRLKVKKAEWKLARF
jgi:hypothetical protein